MHDFLIALAYVGLVLAPAIAAAQISGGTRPKNPADEIPHTKSKTNWWHRP